MERSRAFCTSVRRWSEANSQFAASTRSAFDRVALTPLRNGPLLVRRHVEVRHEDGTLEILPPATLCRCGSSANKPFCDNSHLRVKFQAPGELIHIELSPVRRAVDQRIDWALDLRR